VSQYANGLASVAPDGSLFFLSAGNTQYSGTISYIGNVTGARISTRAVRLFGENTIYTVGMDDSPARDRIYNVEHVGSLVALGSGATRRLVVCLAPGSPAISSPLYLESGLSGSGQFPSPSAPDVLPPQLIEYSTPYFTTSSLVEVTTAAAKPTVITTDAKYGVACDSLRAAGDSVFVRTNSPNAYWQRAGSGSWNQITGNGPANISQIFGPHKGPGATPNDQMRFGFDGSGAPIPYLYSSDPNRSPSTNDTNGPRIWRFSGGSWSSVFPNDALNNASVVDFVAGGTAGGDVYVYLTGSSSYLDNKRFPMSQFVWTSKSFSTPVASKWQFRDASNAPWTGSGVRLHWDYSGKFLAVYGASVAVAYSTTTSTFPSDPDFAAQQYDNQFYLRPFNSVARLNDAGDEWFPAYGGGFSDSGVPSAIFSSPNNEFTYFIGVSDFVYNRYISSGVAVYRSDVGRWTDLYENAGNFNPVSLGGPLDGAVGRQLTTAGVADLYQTKLGNDDVLIAGGVFRTGLKGTVTLNSVVVLPLNADGTAQTGRACGLTSNSLTGVRVSTDGVPENYLITPGSVLAIEYDPSSRQLFVGGSFDSAGDVPASNIAVFQFSENPSCSSNTYTGTWFEAAGGVNGPIFTMERIGNLLYVGGSFTRVGVNQFANNIAAYDIKNRVWITLNAGLDGAVQRILPHNGAVLAAGKFTSGSGRQFPNVAWWDQGAWRGPQIEKNSVACGAGCSYACGREETCSPSWGHVLDVRQISKNELIFLAVSGNATANLWRLDTGAQTGFVKINSGFTTLVNDDGALPLGKGVNANELNVWNVHQSGDDYPQNMLTVWGIDKPSNVLYRTGGGVNGLVYSTWPEYDGN